MVNLNNICKPSLNLIFSNKLHDLTFKWPFMAVVLFYVVKNCWPKGSIPKDRTSSELDRRYHHDLIDMDGLIVPVGRPPPRVPPPLQRHLPIMTPLIFRMKIMLRASHHSTVIQTDRNLMTNYCWWIWGIQRTILVFYCSNQKCLPSCMWPTYGKLGLRQAW